MRERMNKLERQEEYLGEDSVQQFSRLVPKEWQEQVAEAIKYLEEQECEVTAIGCVYPYRWVYIHARPRTAVVFSPRRLREMEKWLRENAPCVVFWLVNATVKVRV